MDNKSHRFQLISPIMGDRIYQTNSFKKGSKKCYEELKGCGKNDFNEFTVMDLDNYETYKFGISRKSKQKHLIQHGGEVNNHIEPDKIVALEQTIKSCSDKILVLEKKIEDLSKIIENPKKIDRTEPEKSEVNNL